MRVARFLQRSRCKPHRASSVWSLSKKSAIVLSYLQVSTCAGFPAPLFFVAGAPYRPFSSSRTSTEIMSRVSEEIEAYNSCASAAVTLTNAYVVEHGDNLLLRVVRSVEDIDNDTKRNYVLSLPIEQSSSAQFILPPTELSPKIVAQIPSPSGTKLAIVRNDDAKDEKTPPRQVLELWTGATTQQPSSLVRRIALPTNEKHGKVINDPATFGSPCWNAEESVIAYVAERKKPETTSFFDPNLNDKDNKKIPGGVNTLGIGKSEQWGEQYHQLEPLLDLYLVNLGTGRVSRVENVPGAEENSTTSLGGYTFSQCIFSPDGKSLLYTGWDAGAGGEMPKRLGLIYCQQRTSKIYCSSMENLLKHIGGDEDKKEAQKDKDFVCLTPKHRLARSPRFSPLDDNGTRHLVFLASSEGFDTHFGYLALHRMDWKNSEAIPSTEKVVVKQRWDIRDRDTAKQEGEVAGIRFPGLALLGLPGQCFVSADTLVTDTFWGSSTKIVRINIRDGTVQLVHACVTGTDASTSSLTSHTLLCVTPKGGIVIKETAPNIPGVIAYIPPEELLGNTAVEQGVSAKPIASLAPLSASTCAAVPASVDPLCGYSYQMLTLERPAEDGNEWSAPIQCILMLPPSKAGVSAKPPLIVLPHGGPHSISTAAFMPEWSFLCGQAGYALLLVNYRGSIGFGQAAAEDLPSRISDLDVKDVVHSVQHVANSGLVDPDKLGICGGSHGGFLTGHCIGQYPNLFKAACMRNPVTNIASMMTSTDIPDWCIVEACGLGKYDWKNFAGPTKEQISEMYDKSPIAHSQKINTPTLVALGTKDLRVPPSQGLEFYHILRSRGVPSKLLMYDDCDHPIGAVCSKADHWINIKRWFDVHMQ